MSGGLQEPQTQGVHHHTHEHPFKEEIPSPVLPAAVGDLWTVDPYSRSIEAPIIVSATLNGKPEKTPNRLTPLILKHVGDLVGIFNHERGTFLSLLSSHIIQNRSDRCSRARRYPFPPAKFATV